MANKKFKEVYSTSYRVGMKSTAGRIEAIDYTREGIQTSSFKRFVDAELPVPVKTEISAKEAVPGDEIVVTLTADLDATHAVVKPIMLRGVGAPLTPTQQVNIATKTITVKFRVLPTDIDRDAVFGVSVNGIVRIFYVRVKKVTGILETPTVASEEITVGAETTINVKVIKTEEDE